MANTGYTPMQPDSTTLNGRYLEHYLKTMENMQATYLMTNSKDSLTSFNKFVYALRAMIPDDSKVKEIDRAMQEESNRIKDMDFTEEQKSFMVGFVVIHHCMKHLDHTLQISKRQVTVRADQEDPAMPEPPCSEYGEVPEAGED